MDSVKNNTPPPEINVCNVLYKNQEFYSKSVNLGDYKEYNSDNEYLFGCLFSSIILTIICIVLIYNAKNKYSEHKSIILYIIVIIILFIFILSSGIVMLTASDSMGLYNNIILPKDLSRPCYSNRVKAILYSDEQLNDIYNNKNLNII